MKGSPPNAESAGSKDEPTPSTTDLGASDLAQFRERLTLFAARRTRNWAEAEDIAQETLKRGLEALQSNKLRDPAALPAFLFATARHVCQQRDRSAGRAERALTRLGASVDGPTDDSLESLIVRERVARVRAMLEKLDSGDREVLSLTYSRGLRADEIARRLDTTAGNVRVRRHRALKRLAELLGVTARPHREP
ncbi:MAG TPA: sigma-70 family RNA polymerase sigma factor [Thermoanaerobaculia bacterium]|nr:sigma-70 family RNA polymerase sigma factor [Thermoanaerobaculia bacterium]